MDFIAVLFNLKRFLLEFIKQKKRGKYLIGVSSGHSSLSRGAYSKILGKSEYDYTKFLSEEIIYFLLDLGYKVYSPDKDSDKLQYPEHLRTTVDKLKDEDIDCALEIHLNSFFDEGVRGTETLYFSNDQCPNLEGRKLAKLIQEEMVFSFATKDRGVKPVTNKHFVRGLYPIPAVILEPLFFSNEEDSKILEKDTFKEDIAISVASSLDRFLDV